MRETLIRLGYGLGRRAAGRDDVSARHEERERVLAEREERLVAAAAGDAERREREQELERLLEQAEALAARSAREAERLRRRADAGSSLVRALRGEVGELRKEARRLRRRPGMWDTRMIAEFCDYVADRLERGLTDEPQA